MDPFVKVIYNDQTYKTNIIKNGGKNVQWYESFEFMTNFKDTIDLIVLDDDYVTSNIIGSARVAIKDMLEYENNEFYLDLFYKG